MNYYKKYIKYKLKYTILQSQMGGSDKQKNRADILHKLATSIEPAITEILNNIIKINDNKLCTIEIREIDKDFKIKTPESLLRKIINDDNEEREKEKKEGKEEEKEIYDTLRYTYIVTFTDPKQTDLSECISHINKLLEEKNIKLVRTKNFFCPNNTYKGINNVYIYNDYKFELQFHTNTSIKIKEINHYLYEKERSLNKETDATLISGIQDAERILSSVITEIYSDKDEQCNK